MGSPGTEHAHHASASDVYEVLREEVGLEVVLDPTRALVAAKQGQMARLALGREAAIEAHDVVIRIARGGREEADARVSLARQRQDVVVQQRAVLLHREASSAEGHDLGGSGTHCPLSLADHLRRP